MELNYSHSVLDCIFLLQYNIPFTDRTLTQIEFLPLNYLMAIITEMEHQGKSVFFGFIVA